MSLSKIVSDESFFGRGNDTQMRYVDGELSHVNKQEAKLIDDYGKKGEELVKEHGSGTINPYTGRKEYFALTWATASAAAAIGTFALGALKEVTGGVSRENKSKLDQEMADNTIDSIESEGGALGLGVSQDSFVSSRSASSFLTKATAIIATLFIITSITLTIISNQRVSSSSVLEKIEEKEDASEPSIPKSDK